MFQSPGLDFRLIALGALLPVLLDLPFGAQSYAHTLLAAVVVLTVTMLATPGRGRRLLRRRVLGLPIGWFSGIVLSATWVHKEVFWWPAFGASRPSAPLFGPWPVVVIEELLGVAAAWWTWSRFGLRDPARRHAFLHDGRLAIVGETEAE